ncbi:MAG: peptide ABC transporter substrate-binding protein [Clostridia bacterium]|nr:peptide ABC transporter substrate-binding protein [Clostridia bacterium]
MKRIISVFLCALMAACVFSSCKKSEITALYFAVSGAASSFDPQIAEDGAVGIVVRNCFEGLVYVDENGEVIPGAAERWEISPDGKTYTFYLRSAKWRLTGTAKEGLGEKLPEDFAPEVTAADFEFALRRACDPATGAEDASLLSNITGFSQIASGEADISTLGVKATGERTLVITLNEPESGFLEVLSEPVCMPCNEEFFEATGGRYGLLIKYIMSNGPFYLTRFDDNSFRMAKNPDYSGEHTAKADVVWLYSGYDAAKVSEGLNEKTLSGALMSEADAGSLSVKKTVVNGVPDILRALIFNLGKREISNENVRLAFLSATDLSDMCAGFNKEKTDRVFPFSNGASPQEGVGFSVKNASKYMEKGLRELEKTDLSFTLLCEERFDSAVRELLQSWQKDFGIYVNVGIENVSSEELESRVKSGEFDMAIYPVSARFFAPFTFFSRFSATDKNSISFLEDSEYDRAVAALRFSSDDAEGSRLSSVEKQLLSGACVLPMWNENSCIVTLGTVSGVRYLGGCRLYFYDAKLQ